MPTTLSSTSNSRLNGVHPDLVKIVRKAALLTTVPFQITEGVRTIERQRLLLKKGATRTLRSRHLTGHAIDVVAYVGNRISWEFPLYYEISQAFKQAARELGIPIEWGGDWRSIKDGPHFQLPWRTHPASATRRPVHQNILSIGAAGSLVMELQRLLSKKGFPLNADGDFGPATRRTVVAFQKRHNLVPDGLVGPATWKVLRK